jgi:nitrogenase molybdenum-cofactor synthesis protein NifE
MPGREISRPGISRNQRPYATPMNPILKDREAQVFHVGSSSHVLKCDRKSVSGSVSQRACAFCGSRVVLYPIADALHLIHGPIGCAAYTWDIRGSLSSGPQLHRLSFSTDLQEQEVIFGGEPKLYRALRELIERYQPKAAFVYSTCIVGIIGDDVEAVCKRVSRECGIDVIMVESEGFKGTKKTGYQAACEAVFKLVGTGDTTHVAPNSINILGDFNIAGESWLIKSYFEAMGVPVIATMTGDGRVDEIRRSHGARLNLVQCSGSMTHLAKFMERDFGIPFIRVSFSGIEDTAAALYETAKFLGQPEMMSKAQALVASRLRSVLPELAPLKRDLEGKRAALYVGGAFKAFSLVRALRMLGMRTVLAGTQTGNQEDYDRLREICDPDTVIVDDSNPLELSRFCIEKDVDLFIGGVKERPIAYKLGIAFCDHNHERKICLAGFEGMLEFAREVHRSVMSPVWDFVPRRADRNLTPDNPKGGIPS